MSQRRRRMRHDPEYRKRAAEREMDLSHSGQSGNGTSTQNVQMYDAAFTPTFEIFSTTFPVTINMWNVTTSLRRNEHVTIIK